MYYFLLVQASKGDLAETKAIALKHKALTESLTILKI